MALNELVKAFNPQRVFSNNHASIEVDGVMLRIPKSFSDVSELPENKDDFEKFLIQLEEQEKCVSSEDMIVFDRERGICKMPILNLLQDPSAVRNARTSTAREDREVDEKAEGMIDYLWRERHVTPIEGGIVFRLLCTMPVDFAQPFFRLLGAHNELSGRYTKIDIGSYVAHSLNGEAREIFDEAIAEGHKRYEQLLTWDVAKEQARWELAYAFNTRFFMTISLREILKFIGLENVSTRHTRDEFWTIRDLFRDIIRTWTPWIYNSFEKKTHAMDFSWVEKYSTTDSWVPKLDAIRVLDKGRITLIEKYGTESIVRKYLKDFPDPAKAFGHAGMIFDMCMPIFVFRQLVRHRYAHWSEITPDFDRIVDERLFFEPTEFCRQTGKVGHYVFTPQEEDQNKLIAEYMRETIDLACNRYKRLRVLGVPQDIASKILPYRFYVDVGLTICLESLFNLFSLRTDSHAQEETKQYAKAIWPMFVEAFPWAAVIYAKYFSYSDWDQIKKLENVSTAVR